MTNKGWWLASPNQEYLEYSLLFDVYKAGGRLNNSDPYMDYDYRPIVCMKTSVFQEKYEKTLVDE